MKGKKVMFGAFISVVFLLGHSAYADSGGDDYIVYLKTPQNRIRAAQSETNKNYITASADELQKLLKDGNVTFYEPNCEVKLFEDFSGDQATGQWNFDSIKLSKAWQIGCYGNDVKVGVIDSGVYKHPDLTANLFDGHNYLTGSDDTADNIGHGTFVSGIIAAEANGEYIDGIAYHAKIVPLKCFDNGYTTKASMIADAIYDAVDIYGCDVINMSFGMQQSLTSTTLQLSIKYAQQNGCILVASAGNDGNSTVYYPAKYDGVIGVGAVDKNNQLSRFSQKNNTVDVVAPGQGISSISIPAFNKSSGTSFSAPHVSAMAAIAKCIDENITAAEFQDILQKTSTQLGEGEYNTSFGYGLINIQAMIDEMLKGTEVFISPIEKTNGGTNVTLYNNGSRQLSAKGIVAEYNEKQLAGFVTKDINLQSNETVVLNGGQNNNVKFMLWSGWENLKPLTVCKEK